MLSGNQNLSKRVRVKVTADRTVETPLDISGGFQLTERGPVGDRFNEVGEFLL
jgi:hypothetical protein